MQFIASVRELGFPQGATQPQILRAAKEQGWNPESNAGELVQKLNQLAPQVLAGDGEPFVPPQAHAIIIVDQDPDHDDEIELCHIEQIGTAVMEKYYYGKLDYVLPADQLVFLGWKP